MELTTLSSLRACRTLKTVVKRKFFMSPRDPFVTSDVSDAHNCGKTQISHFAEQPFRPGDIFCDGVFGDGVFVVVFLRCVCVVVW